MSIIVLQGDIGTPVWSFVGLELEAYLNENNIPYKTEHVDGTATHGIVFHIPPSFADVITRLKLLQPNLIHTTTDILSCKPTQEYTNKVWDLFRSKEDIFNRQVLPID